MGFLYNFVHLKKNFVNMFLKFRFLLFLHSLICMYIVYETIRNV
jgi:hypothetical protein